MNTADPAAPPPDPSGRRPLKSRSLGSMRALASSLVSAGVSPNSVSLAGVAFAAAGFAALFGLSRGWAPAWPLLVLAAVCVQLRLLCNLLDGMVAIEGGRKTRGGDMFNEIPDRIEDALFLAGAGYACGYPELGWICTVLAVFTAYVRAFGASLGQGQDFGGPCAKPHRMFYLTVGLLAAAVGTLFGLRFNILACVLGFIAAATALTAALRIRRMYGRSK